MTSGGEEIAPRDLVDDIVAAWNSHDPSTFGALFDDTAEYTDVVGNHVVGTEAIVALHVFPFSAIFPRATLTLTELRERPLGEGWVSLDAFWQVTGHSSPQGAPLAAWDGVMHVVAQRRGQRWQPVVVHNHNLTYARGTHPQPPAGAPPSHRRGEPSRR